MTNTYANLKKQIHQLQARANALKAQEVAGVIDRIKAAIDEHGLTGQDLGLTTARVVAKRAIARSAGGPAAAKFADGTGQVWGGRGRRPAWLREALASGRALDEFAVGQATRRKAVATTPAPPEQTPAKAGRKAPGKRAVGAATKTSARKSASTSSPATAKKATDKKAARKNAPSASRGRVAAVQSQPTQATVDNTPVDAGQETAQA